MKYSDPLYRWALLTNHELIDFEHQLDLTGCLLHHRVELVAKLREEAYL